MISPVKVWRNQKQVKNLVGLAGRVTAWTLIRVPPSGFSAQAPYPVVVVKLDSGQKITCQMVDWEDKHLTIGQKVITIIRKITEPDTDGVILYGIKAKPNK